jgi:hypothetical protein
LLKQRLHRADGAPVYRLVGVVPGRTDIDVFWLGDFGSIEIAKIAMPDHVEAFVQKATLNDQSSFAVDHFLIDRLARRDCQIVRAEPPPKNAFSPI